ncbi:U3 small nucleolar RNA-associated protein 21 -like protein [Ceratocystis fimbriata CBS 114723]|uniref:U3 small nucleolar RNA-associated protein 21-like protein n=1 Tax=Ceratocystis fimbriata CBS 114723 TaxID=1035309 RepID=A0A2C5XAC2_9PEZI|nr:U3 small nucleolar RNA-associated protein 21 -like protein [Ceratocystis fimbriata CBS 114723]
MPHSQIEGPLVKRQKRTEVAKAGSTTQRSSAIFAPFRTVGLVSPTAVPFTSVPLGKTTFQITTSIGRSLQTYDLKRGLNLVFISRPQTAANITSTLAWKQKVFAAWGDPRQNEPQGLWVFQRGRKVDELALPHNLDEPITQILVFGQWIVGCGLTRIEVWKSATLDHYTTLHLTATNKGDNEITGGITNMPTYLNKIFVGRKNGWVEIWNISTGKLIYTIVPPSTELGAVICMRPTPALSMLAIAFEAGPLIVQDVLVDKTVIQLIAGTPEVPVSSISFRTDGAGAGPEGRDDGVMATSSLVSGDVTFWDLNKGGRIMGVLRSAHNPPTSDGKLVRGGIGKIDFLSGQPVIITSGRDNSLKSWIFDEEPFSPIPRILHSRSGHAAPVTCLHFLPSDFDGSEAGNKWLLSGGKDRSLWGWSLRRDGQSTEISQGNIRKKAKKYGILSTSALSHGPTTSLEDIKAPEITCIATSLNRDGGMGAVPGKQAIWQKAMQKGPKKTVQDAEISGMTGWESVVTGHKGDSFARTWFWGRKRAGRWMFPTGDSANVSTVAISPCGSFALVGSEGGCVDMYNLQSGQYRQRFPSKLTPAQARQLKMQQLRQADSVVQFSTKLASTAFPPGTGKHTKAVTGIVVDSLNKHIISCSLDGTVKFWDFLTGNLLYQIDWTKSVEVTACRYHAANDLLAVSCSDNSIRVIDLETRRTIREFWGSQGAILDFCFSNDGRWIIASGSDKIVRVYDLSTGHLIDAIRLEKQCTALAMSATGEYLATSIDGEMGVNIWTNKSLFRHVATRQISEEEIAVMAAPSASGEGNAPLLEAALEDRADADTDAGASGVMVPAVDQLSADMMTLSLIPKARWQTLLHLDLIKQRNKPKEAPKVPEAAPFFLPSVGSNLKPIAANLDDKEGTTAESRITKLERMRAEEAFTERLLNGAATGNYTDFIEHLQSLPPSTADFELRSLSSGSSGSSGNELLHFIRALTQRLQARRDYELMQAWMAVFLRHHSDSVIESPELLDALAEWKTNQEKESARLDDLTQAKRQYCEKAASITTQPCWSSLPVSLNIHPHFAMPPRQTTTGYERLAQADQHSDSEEEDFLAQSFASLQHGTTTNRYTSQPAPRGAASNVTSPRRGAARLHPHRRHGSGGAGVDLKAMNARLERWADEIAARFKSSHRNRPGEEQRLEIHHSVFQAPEGVVPITPDKLAEVQPVMKQDEFEVIVNSVRRAIDRNVHPLMISQGSSGSYFARNSDGKVVGVFKPKDEEPYAAGNPKWNKWIHRNLFPCFFGRACLIPNLSYVSEAAAYTLDCQLRTHMVPYTDVVYLSSKSFHYPFWDRHSFYRKKKPLPEKPGSFQVFLKGFKDANIFLRENPWPDQYWSGFRTRDGTRRSQTPRWTDSCRPSGSRQLEEQAESQDIDPESQPLGPDNFRWTDALKQSFREELEKLVILDYIMRNTDRGLDNWMVKVDWSTQQVSIQSEPMNFNITSDSEDDNEDEDGNEATPGPRPADPSRIKNPSMQRASNPYKAQNPMEADATPTATPKITIGAIDNSLSWPWKHPDAWRSFPFGWLFLPVDLIGRPFSQKTRDHFLPLLTSTHWWSQTQYALRKVFQMDEDFQERMFAKQMAVMKGQAWNVVETLKTPDHGPLELTRRAKVCVWDDLVDVPVAVPMRSTSSEIHRRQKSAGLDDFDISGAHPEPDLLGLGSPSEMPNPGRFELATSPPPSTSSPRPDQQQQQQSTVPNYTRYGPQPYQARLNMYSPDRHGSSSSTAPPLPASTAAPPASARANSHQRRYSYATAATRKTTNNIAHQLYGGLDGYEDDDIEGDLGYAAAQGMEGQMRKVIVERLEPVKSRNPVFTWC